MAKMRAVVWCVCVVVLRWGGAEAQMGRNMLLDLTDELDREPVRFSEPSFNHSVYTADLNFDMRAMGMLYNCSPRVVNTICKKQAYPEGIVSVSDGHVNVKPLRQEWRTLLSYYQGPAAVAVASLLVIAVLPLAGLFWCCWYCCRMGRRRRPFDRKYDEWLKGVLTILLIGLLTLFLFGVVCAFATDSQVDQGATEISTTLRKGFQDIHSYLDTVRSWANTLLLINYQELETSLIKQQKTLGLSASWKMGAFSRAASVTTLNQMVQELGSVQRKLRSVQELTATLRLKAEELNSGLRKVKHQLLQTLAKCDQPKCRALQEKYKIGQLDTEIQYSQMPDVSGLLRNVTALLDSGIREDMADAQRAFELVQRSVQRDIDARMPDVARSLGGVGDKLKQLQMKVKSILDDLDRKLWDYEKYFVEYDRLHAKYGPYRRLAALAASISLLLITVMLTLGLLCGVCGKRPDVYGANDCCNKGTGTKCLLCGMFLIFLLGGVVAAVMLAHFVLGVVGSRFVCDPLTEPRGNRLFQDVDRMVDIEMLVFNTHAESNFTLTSVLVACHANMTIYRTLHLWRFLNVMQLRTEMLEQLEARAPPPGPPPAPGPPPPGRLLRAGLTDKLRQFADAGLSDFDFDRILDALESNMTSLALEPLAAQLLSTARSLQQPLLAPEAASLRRAAAALSELQEDVLRPMLDASARLNTTARELRDELRFNRSSMKEAVRFLAEEMRAGQDFLGGVGGNLGNLGGNVGNLGGNVGNLGGNLGNVGGNLGNVGGNWGGIGKDAYDKAKNATHGAYDAAAGASKGAVDAARDAYDAAKDKYEKAKNASHGAYDAAVSASKGALDAARDAYEKAKNASKDAYDKGKGLYDAGRNWTHQAGQNIKDFVGQQVNGFLGSLTESLMENAARCGPLSHAFNVTRDAFCHKTLLPIHGFWMSLAWCLLLLLPLLLVTHRLARLYRRAEPYPGPLVDAEYLYDAYADRDNVPLANSYKAEKRSSRSSRSTRESSGPSGPSGGSSAGDSRSRATERLSSRDSSLAPPLDSYHARRYNDMAPKHWEEGPPRYLGTEYERPPPYYYPGPHDRQ